MASLNPIPNRRWPKSTGDCAGTEFDWFCVDLEGFVAVLSSAGRGPIPESFFRMSIEQYNDILASVAARTPCKAKLMTSARGTLTDWKEYAEQGLFALDFQDVHRTSATERNGYDLIYRPDQPMHVTNLPESVSLSLPVCSISFSIIDFLPSKDLPF